MKQNDFLKKTNIYKNFVSQRDEILKNKWYMSEKHGKDVGFERALIDWSLNHRQNWITSTTKSDSEHYP